MIKSFVCLSLSDVYLLFVSIYVRERIVDEVSPITTDVHEYVTQSVM